MPNSSRRDFFKKLSLGLVGSTAIGSSNVRQSEILNPVKKVKPMGFNWDTIDPFLFCVHHEDFFPKGNQNMGPQATLDGRSLGDDFIIKDGWRMYHGTEVPGFPGHPHRGFETITIVRKGMVDHADSLGAAGRYGQGDVQWMTAGKGVQHSEMFPLLETEKDNPLELFQIWLNLPAKNKMVAPHFKMLWGSKIPKYEFTDSKGVKGVVEVIAGKLYGHTAPAPPPGSWAADPSNEVAIYNIHIDANGSFTLPKAGKGINRMLYFYEGSSMTIEGTTIKKYHAAEVHSDFDLNIQTGSEKTKILVLQGKPINEPVMQYGPFVMNTKEEIQKAFNDFHATKFGGWPWGKYDQVHDRKLSRFARHADGTFEEGV
ncbi:MAG: pirin family protein [Saprospiraceae bacterium]|nr:pirin family protein [Saprospiraceae bacterium]